MQGAPDDTMSYEVTLVVTFQALPDEAESVAEVARRHLPAIEERYRAAEERGLWEAVYLLTSIAEGKGFTGGSKWGMFTWGTVGNYVPVDTFVDVLRPFWEELLSIHADEDGWGGPLPGNTIVVLFESYSAGQAGAVEISFPATRWWWARSPSARRTLPPEQKPQLCIKKYERLPFSLVRGKDPE